MICEEDWAPMEAAFAKGSPMNRTARKRVAPGSGHDLHIIVDGWTGHRGMQYRFPSSDLHERPDFPGLKSVGTRYDQADDGTGTTTCTVELLDDSLKDVFSALVGDVVASVAVTSDAYTGVCEMTRRLSRWERLLSPERAGGLSVSERRGLFGELTILLACLDSGIDPRAAAAGWTGPQRRHQDFQMGSAAIEVKTTTAKQPQALTITSERELDSLGVAALYLSHVSLDERQGGVGESLADLVARVRHRLDPVPSAQEQYDRNLLEVGYLHQQAHLYEEPRYTVREVGHYHVAGEFPRITEGQLAPGVGNVAYRLQLAAIKPYEVDLEQIVSRLIDVSE